MKKTDPKFLFDEEPNEPSLWHENQMISRFAKDGMGQIAGIDEAGRGPWAGPVVASAVILNPVTMPPGLNDSKKLTKKKREALFIKIMETQDVGIGITSVEEIDEINILQASLLAMRRAAGDLSEKLALKNRPLASGYLIDGNHDAGLDLPSLCLIKGDGRSFSIAAASIIAKVFRDQIMADLAKIHPAYGWEKNAGYGVSAHIEGLKLVGVSPHHRKSFKPIKRLLHEEITATY
jgi:ribonuclease HII